MIDIKEKLLWAINTIRDKEMFGLDELNASLSRERRAKGSMLDAVKAIDELEKQNAELKAELMGKEIGFVHSLDWYRDQHKQLEKQNEKLKILLKGWLEHRKTNSADNAFYYDQLNYLIDDTEEVLEEK